MIGTPRFVKQPAEGLDPPTGSKEDRKGWRDVRRPLPRSATA